MELLLGYLGYELLGTIILVITVYLSARKKKPKPVQPSKLDQIARETARLEAENKRLEREYETLRDEKFSVLEPAAKPLIGPETLAVIQAKERQFEADVRAVRVKAEFAYYQSKGELPPNSLLDSRTLDELTSYYELSIAKAFNTVPLILTNGTRIEFRKLS